MSFGSIISAVGGLIGGHQDREFARAQSAADRAFQKEVYQNQIQWKAADAKKAGLHPLAILGSGSYSASPSSVPSSSSMADSLGKLGEGIGDAFTAYMKKDEVAELAKDAKEQRDLDKQKTRAEIEEISARAMESARRALSYSVPMSNGAEYIRGQTDSYHPSLLGGKVGDTYAVRPVGNGRYDINFSTDYQQEIGDELGQVVNAIKSWTRGGGNGWYGVKKALGVDPGPRYGKMWRNPETGEMFRFDRESGYWDKLGWTE